MCLAPSMHACPAGHGACEQHEQREHHKHRQERKHHYHRPALVACVVKATVSPMLMSRASSPRGSSRGAGVIINNMGYGQIALFNPARR